MRDDGDWGEARRCNSWSFVLSLGKVYRAKLSQPRLLESIQSLQPAYLSSRSVSLDIPPLLDI